MFGKYAFKRIIFGIISFVIIIFMYATILNTTLEATVHSQITMMVKGFMMTDAAKDYLPEEIPELKAEYRKRLEHTFGLDRPFIIRVLDRTKEALIFNFGETSFTTVEGSNDIKDVVWEAAQNTLILFGTSSVICVWLGLLLGKLKAKKNGSHFDKSTSIMTMVFFGTPSWWIGSIMIFIFVYTNRIFPGGAFHSTPIPTGFFPYVIDSIYHILPIASLVLVGFWGTAYIVRNILLSNLEEDYIMITLKKL